MFNDNPDFFPTPKPLINKMFSYLDFRMLSSILEPSGGKGDLIEAIEEKFKTINRYSRNKADIDTIEQDENLVSILKSKQHRVIASDFLNFHTYKSYSAIIMNPPYSSGDRHLLRAIDLIENQPRSGAIVCLLNSETIKNPYTNTRKELIKKLEQYDAKVEYIQDAFVSAERKTNVETALVYLHISKTNYNSVILDDLKREEQEVTSKQYTSDKLIHNDFIEGIVSQFNYEIKAGLKLIQEYRALEPYMLNSFEEHNKPILKLELDYKDDSCSLENGYIKQIRAKYWRTLFNNKQFMGLFTSNLKRKYIDRVEELKDYDFSPYNIYTVRIQLSKEMVQGVEDTILALFEEFSHKHYYDETSKNIHLYNGWKTNKSYKINKKVIIPLNGFNGWFDKYYRPTDYKVLDKLKDIEKVFNYLDNNQTEELDIEEALKFAEAYGETKKIDLKFFTVTFYKKGTAHLEFKQLDLLHKFNLYAAKSKMWLPPTYGNVKYKDMTNEEKEVIDQFEGESSYNKVMNNKSYFIVESDELLKLVSA